MSNQVQQKPKTGIQKFNGLVTNEQMQEYLGSVLGEKKSSFINNITALVANNKALQSCEPATIIYAGIKATALDLPLDPSLGFAYVIPYGNAAQFQIGYKGFIQLAQRSGQFEVINVRDVREGEIEEEDFVTGEITFKRAEDREKQPVVGYMAYFKLLNGFKKMIYMTKGEVEAHAKKFSKTYAKGGVWKTDFDAMAEKTVIKKLFTRYAPMSIEMADAVKADQSVIDANGMNYVDAPTVLEHQVSEVEREIDEDGVVELNSADEFAGMEPNW